MDLGISPNTAVTMKTLVMKFGGASVASPEHFSDVADIILDRFMIFERLAIVVSAMGDTTDKLDALAKRVHPQPPRREYDMLVSIGERISISLLAMAIAAKGGEAVSFTGSQSGIITCPQHSSAMVVDVRPKRLLAAFAAGQIAIVAGFQGVSTQGEITTLGRGGSDTTAVALGVALNADRVEFYKDVPGIFESDPKEWPDAKPFTSLTYDEAMHIVNRSGQILHPRSLRLACLNALPLFVRSFYGALHDQDRGTLIHDASRIRPEHPIFEQQFVDMLVTKSEANLGHCCTQEVSC